MLSVIDTTAAFFAASRDMRSRTPKVRKAGIAALIDLAGDDANPMRDRAVDALAYDIGPSMRDPSDWDWPGAGCVAPGGLNWTCDAKGWDCKTCRWYWPRPGERAEGCATAVPAPTPTKLPRARPRVSDRDANRFDVAQRNLTCADARRRTDALTCFLELAAKHPKPFATLAVHMLGGNNVDEIMPITSDVDGEATVREVVTPLRPARPMTSAVAVPPAKYDFALLAEAVELIRALQDHGWSREGCGTAAYKAAYRHITRAAKHGSKSVRAIATAYLAG